MTDARVNDISPIVNRLPSLLPTIDPWMGFSGYTVPVQDNLESDIQIAASRKKHWDHNARQRMTFVLLSQNYAAMKVHHPVS